MRPVVTQVELPEVWRQRWQQWKTVDINEVEAVGPLIALSTWPHLQQGLWIHWIDNTSAQNTLVRGASSTEALNDIGQATWDETRRRRLYLWVERVPTKDNPIDAASRRDFRDLWNQNWQWTPARLPTIWPNT